MRAPVVDVRLNLDMIPPGKLPSFRPRLVGEVEMLVASIGEVTIWLRADQVNELASKLMVHLPTADAFVTSEGIHTREQS